MSESTKRLAKFYACDGRFLPVDAPTITKRSSDFLQVNAQAKKYSDPITTLAISAQPLDPFGRAAKFGYIA
jgi:hypothetical protein